MKQSTSTVNKAGDVHCGAGFSPDWWSHIQRQQVTQSAWPTCDAQGRKVHSSKPSATLSLISPSLRSMPVFMSRCMCSNQQPAILVANEAPSHGQLPHMCCLSHVHNLVRCQQKVFEGYSNIQGEHSRATAPYHTSNQMKATTAKCTKPHVTGNEHVNSSNTARQTRHLKYFFAQLWPCHSSNPEFTKLGQDRHECLAHSASAAARAWPILKAYQAQQPPGAWALAISTQFLSRPNPVPFRVLLPCLSQLQQAAQPQYAQHCTHGWRMAA